MSPAIGPPFNSPRLTLGHPPDITGLATDRIVTTDGAPYLDRYHLAYTPTRCVRFHHWHSSDDQRAHHDHPWDNTTLVIAGHLLEHTPASSRHLHPGDIAIRDATTPHAIELISDDAWTLFVTGPIIQSWGFHTAAGWINWRRYPHAGRIETNQPNNPTNN